jgi:hypothetical protein
MFHLVSEVARYIDRIGRKPPAFKSGCSLFEEPDIASLGLQNRLCAEKSAAAWQSTNVSLARSAKDLAAFSRSQPVRVFKLLAGHVPLQSSSNPQQPTAFPLHTFLLPFTLEPNACQVHPSS